MYSFVMVTDVTLYLHWPLVDENHSMDGASLEYSRKNQAIYIPLLRWFNDKNVCPNRFFEVYQDSPSVLQGKLDKHFQRNL